MKQAKKGSPASLISLGADAYTNLFFYIVSAALGPAIERPADRIISDARSGASETTRMLAGLDRLNTAAAENPELARAVVTTFFRVLINGKILNTTLEFPRKRGRPQQWTPEALVQLRGMVNDVQGKPLLLNGKRINSTVAAIEHLLAEHYKSDPQAIAQLLGLSDTSGATSPHKGRYRATAKRWAQRLAKDAPKARRTND